jgi:hypothetical protein
LPEHPHPAGDDDTTTTSTSMDVSAASAGAGGHVDQGCDHGDAGQGGGGDTSDPPDGLWPAKGLTITRITLNQGVRHTLMEAGKAQKDDTPLVADRPGLLRVFYEQFAEHGENRVIARLTIGDAIFIKEVAHGTASLDAQLGSTINFEVPRELIGHGMSYRVDLLHPAGGGADVDVDVDGSAFPAELQQPVSVLSTGDGLKVVLVPIRYTAGGADLMPDLSDAQIALHRKQIMAWYPVREVELSVRGESLDWDQTLGAKGEGWPALLTAVADLRSTDDASNDSYYYGVFMPDANFNSFCSQGCVAGLGFVSPEMNSWSRAAIGLGYAGVQMAEVFAHELGHNHGRVHSPCGGPANPDPDYPHADGSIGSWGFDIIAGELHAPTASRDFMSYCNPAWVSKFTYGALYDRARLLNNVLLSVQNAEPRQYDRAILSAGGTAEWTSDITLSVPPQGEPRTVDVTSDAGQRQEIATFVPFDHIDGGVLFVPRPANGRPSDRARQMRFQAAGRSRWLKR